MPDEIQKPNLAAEARAQAKAKREARQKHVTEMKALVGGTFIDDGVQGTIKAFVEDKELGGVRADAFLVNFGQSHRDDFVHCENFLATFKPKE